MTQILSESGRTGDPLVHNFSCCFSGGQVPAAAFTRSKQEQDQATKVGRYYVECGTSGEVFDLERDYCLMIGGEDQVVKLFERFGSRGVIAADGGRHNP